jgi:vancomycin resistance protein YoaR
VDLAAQGAAALQKRTIVPVTHVDADAFSAELDILLADIDTPAQDAKLLWDNRAQKFTRTEASGGRIADREMLRTGTLAAVEPLREPLPGVFGTLIAEHPEILGEALDEGETLFTQVLDGAPYTVEAGDYELTLTRQMLAPWLTLTRTDADTLQVGLDDAALHSFLTTSIAPSVNRPARDAVFDVHGGRVQAFILAQDGQELDSEAATLALTDGIRAATQEPITLPVRTTAPAITNDSAESLGIKELLAVGETTFTGSPANRKHNIGVGARRYDGLLIAPGQEFSFNQFLGPVDAASGYKPELVIKPEGTVPEYGGGLCQVSTTAFQAAVKAGLTITQRRNHSYIVRYYGAPGFDATIYPPSVDMKFVNDTPGHILVQTEVVGDIIRFYYYGTSDGRKTTVDGPHTLSLNADGSGSAILRTQTVMADGEVRDQVFRSSYRSPALYPRTQQNPLE